MLWILLIVQVMAVTDAHMPDEPGFPAFHIGDVLKKARLHPRSGESIRSADRMAELLTEVLGHEVSRSAVNAWESLRNQPGRNGIRLQDVVVGYSRVTGWPASTLWERASVITCFSETVQVRAVADPEGVHTLAMFDDDLEPIPFRKAELASV